MCETENGWHLDEKKDEVMMWEKGALGRFESCQSRLRLIYVPQGYMAGDLEPMGHKRIVT